VIPVNSDCTLAPFTVCADNTTTISNMLGQLYIDPADGYTVLPVTTCEQAFRSATGGFLAAYEYVAPTLTSDRMCSICSSCPSGFDVVPCTAFTNTQCTQSLSAGQVAGIIVGVLVPTFGFVIALLYIRYATYRSELGQTKTYLELTEQLLGDERVEKEQMEQAWTIAESDISFGVVIGEGAFGRVYKGRWGHIEVAIKVLRMPIDELDVSMRADFDREVKFMRSIRRCVCVILIVVCVCVCVCV
jgi:hypothetical protein